LISQKEPVSTVHIPILVEPILNALLEPFRALPEDAPSHYYVDCTLGGGGHTSAFLEAFAQDPKLQKHRVLAFDQDARAIERARARFSREIEEGRLELFHKRFSEIEEILEGKPVLGLLADLGFSSDQMDDPSRGLSFQAEGPLDMRMDPERGVSCRDYLFRVSEAELEEVLREYGEERFSRRIASAIMQSRREKRLPSTTKELSELVVRAIPPAARHGRIHAATRTFQALRIVVNEELNELDCLLNRVILKLKTGGRVAILSFHSLEDRKVKHVFRGKDVPFEPLTKKPIEADEAEVRMNPRSRSAKLRVATRL
jgi:16S rRNA (cytosine1402-N4)-methyltransferase